MSVAYFLIGAPASGKSTWREIYMATATIPTTVVSTDDLIEEWAAKNGMTYTEAFNSVNLREIEAAAMAQFEAAIERGDVVIIDRTNLKLKVRNKFHRMIPAHYKKHAVIFSVPRDVLQHRLDARALATGKSIPTEVVDNMLASYAEPLKDEFHVIEQVTF